MAVERGRQTLAAGRWRRRKVQVPPSLRALGSASRTEQYAIKGKREELGSHLALQTASRWPAAGRPLAGVAARSHPFEQQLIAQAGACGPY